MAPPLHLILLLLPLIGGASCTFSLFLPEKSAEYLQQAPEQFAVQGERYVQQPQQQGQQYLQQQQQGQQYLQQLQGQQYLQQLQGQQQGQPQQPEQYDNQAQYGQDYSLQQPQQQTSSIYWSDGEQQPSQQEYQQQEDDPSGYRYQSYQSTYRHQVHSVPGVVPTYGPQLVPTYAYPAYHQLAQQHPQIPPYQQLPDPVYQQGGEGVVPSPHRLSPPTSLPVYQLVTIGPEVPVLVRLPNQQTAILPVRTVYSLPNFLERIVQRVQNYYSVYNPLEVLKVPRHNFTEQASGSSTTEASSSTAEGSTDSTTSSSDGSGQLSDRIASSVRGDSSTTGDSSKVSTLKVFEVSPTTTTEQAGTTTTEEASTTTLVTTTMSEENEIQGETTTTTTSSK